MSNDNTSDGKRNLPEGRKLTDLTPKTSYRSDPTPARSYDRGKIKTGGDMSIEGTPVGGDDEAQFPAPVHEYMDRYGALSSEQLAEIVSFCELANVGRPEIEGAMSWNQAARELGVNELVLKKIVESYRVGIVLGDGDVSYDDLHGRVLQLQYRVLNMLGIMNQKTGAKLLERLNDDGEFQVANKDLIKLFEVSVKGTGGVMKGLTEAAAVSIEADKVNDDQNKIIQIKEIFSAAQRRVESGENIND